MNHIKGINVLIQYYYRAYAYLIKQQDIKNIKKELPPITRNFAVSYQIN